MWNGLSSLVTEDSLPLQQIGYIKTIEHLPTRLDVVKETLVWSKKVASECGDSYAIVTYDLAIAKPALQMQAQESPRFGNVFFCFGAFHISMAYFSGLGHILEFSGGTEISCATDILATCSVRGFVGRKHFNHCKHIHPCSLLPYKSSISGTSLQSKVVLASPMNVVHCSIHSLRVLCRVLSPLY